MDIFLKFCKRKDQKQFYKQWMYKLLIFRKPYRKQDSDLFPADTELERTLRSLRKTKRAEKATMADERNDHTVEQRTAAGRPPFQDTMEDFWRPIIQEEYSAIRQPTVDANNFELKPSLITMVQ